METTAAHVHDLTPAAQLLHGGETPKGRLDDLVETAKAHIRAKVEHPFRVI
jgi:IS5 family transposase